MNSKLTLLNLSRRLVFCALACIGAATLYWVATDILMLLPSRAGLFDLLSRIDPATAWLLLLGFVLFMMLIELFAIAYVMFKTWRLPRIIFDASANSYFKVVGARKRPRSRLHASRAEVLAYSNLGIIRRKLNLKDDLEIELLVEESREMNAYTLGMETLMGGRHAICLSSALIEKLPSANVAAVLAHELGHVRHQDSATKIFMSGVRAFLSTILFAPVYLVYLVIYVLHLIFRLLPILSVLGRFFLFLLGLLLGIMKILELMLLWPARLYELHVSRHSEYLADAVASRSVGPLTVCRVFFYLERLNGSAMQDNLYRLTDKLKILSSTHPSTKQRIHAIQRRTYAKAVGNLATA